MADKSEERLFVAIYTDADVHGKLASHDLGEFTSRDLLA